MPTEKSVFSKIIDRELPSEILSEGERHIVIASIQPEAPVHLLGIPKKPYANLEALLADPEGEAILHEVLSRLIEVGKAKGVGESGYRILTNTGPDAGQTVFHLHFHLLGGRRLESDTQAGLQDKE